MKPTLVPSLLLAAVALAGCESLGMTQPAFEDEIVAANRALEERFRAGDVLGVADLYTDDAVELFIDTLNAGAPSMQPHDYQLLINARNVQGDLRGTGFGKDASWNAAWQSAVRARGTLNNDALNLINSALGAALALGFALRIVAP